MKERLANPGRRAFVSGAVALAALPAYGMFTDVEAKEFKHKPKEPDSWLSIEPSLEHKRVGEYVKIDELMLPKLPTPNPKEVLGAETGLIISKRFHRFWLFKYGKLLQEGPVGTARYDKGQDTPEGLFTIIRREGASYSSGEFPARDPNEPNMPYASFFHRRGLAFHGSLNFAMKHRANGKDVEYLRLDNSHGCANARRADAELVNRELKIGDRVAVLP